MKRLAGHLIHRLTDHLPLVILVAMYLLFSLYSDRFFEVQTVLNILKQSAALGIIAVGMALVVLAGGIDLSVGSTMYLALAVAGTMLTHGGLSQDLALPVILLAGVLAGLMNGLGMVWFGLSPFVTTLASLAIYRGLGSFLTGSAPIMLPGSVNFLGRSTLFGVPTPFVVFAAMLLAGWWIATRTAFGRYFYAMGINPAGAATAGIPVKRCRIVAHTICGFTAALGGIVLASQFGVVTATYGTGAEFEVIAIVVLSGISLYGGRGSVFPGVLAGALILQTVNAGLIFARVDVYLQPIIFAAIIFLAVFVDSQRSRFTARLGSVSRKSRDR